MVKNKNNDAFSDETWYQNIWILLASTGSKIFDLKTHPDIMTDLKILNSLNSLKFIISEWFIEIDLIIESKEFKSFSNLAISNSLASFVKLEENFLNLELEEFDLTQEPTNLIQDLELNIRKLINLISYFESRKKYLIKGFL